MKKLVIATHNRDKFKEMQKALEGLGWEIVAAFDFPGVPEVEEDGKTLEENSLKKAKVLSAFTGLPALSDDTGFFIDALGGNRVFMPPGSPVKNVVMMITFKKCLV